IHVASRTAGMKVFVVATNKTWTLAIGNLTTWVEVPTVSIVRATHSFTPGAPIADTDHADFVVATGKTAIVLAVMVSDIDLRVEAHSTSARTDSNPYAFVSYTGHLSDDGTSVLEDESTQFNRRFAIVSNLELSPASNTY